MAGITNHRNTSHRNTSHKNTSHNNTSHHNTGYTPVFHYPTSKPKKAKKGRKNSGHIGGSSYSNAPSNGRYPRF